MAKTVAVKKSFNFVGGLNTEGGPLVFPPNTWQDGDNIVPNIDGSLSKRFAINFESGYALSPAEDSATEEQNGAYVCEEWNSVGGDGNTNFIVVQRNDLVCFYVNDGAGVSPTLKSFTINLATYRAPGNTNSPGMAPIACANADGRLIITSSDTEPLLVTYNPGNDTIDVSIIQIQIRDLKGVDDGLAVDERPASLTEAHRYNLLNQGWSATHYNAYKNARGVYPSNAQVWTAGKNASDDFSATLLDKQHFGTTPAARGHYILNAFRRNRNAVSGLSQVPTENELFRPTSCAFYAGRAWFAGAKSDTVGSWVFFSQVADSPEKYGRCYQDADPTSEFVSDLVDTDGGVIPIQDAGTIVKLLPAYNSILVFADNGLWQISGGLESNFSATSYEVKKLASVGCVGAASVVEAETTVFFWSHDGVWAVALSETGSLEVVSVTSTTIQSLYIDIPVAGRAFVRGRYDTENKTVYWGYNDNDQQDGSTRRFKKNRLLCLDMRLRAFYTLSVSELQTNSPYFTDLIFTKTRSSTTVAAQVVDGNEDPVVADTDNVIVTLTPAVLRNSEARFLTLVPSTNGFKLTFSRFEDGATQASRFRDWYAADNVGASYDAYILTGYDFGQDQAGDKRIQALYITVFCKRTETGVDAQGNPINPSSVMFQSRWDWTDSTAANKWSGEYEVYRHTRPFMPPVPSSGFNDGYPVVVTKNKVRGRGRAVQFKFSAAADKDFQLLGWAITYLGNQNV